MDPPLDREPDLPRRRFLLAPAPDGQPPRLLASEEDHARRVLRLGIGDTLLGLDRRGGALPLRVGKVARGEFELEPCGERRMEPEPGAPGATLPWFELWLSLPRPPRAEALVERLAQLGAAACQPLLLERTPPRSRTGRPARLERIADEALKQSGRLWPLELAPPRELSRALLERPPGTLVVLDPRAGPTLWAVLEALEGPAGEGPGTRARPLVLVAGPEGGLSPAEAELLAGRGARPARLAPHVLRIETAAEAAAAIVAQHALERRT